MRVRSLWYLVILITCSFLALKRMYKMLNLAVPHYLTIFINNPPYVIKTLYPAYPTYWRHVTLWALVVLVLAAAIVAVLAGIAKQK